MYCTYRENPVVVPRVSTIVSRHVQHFAFHLFAAASTVNSLNANRMISGCFCLLVVASQSLELAAILTNLVLVFTTLIFLFMHATIEYIIGYSKVWPVERRKVDFEVGLGINK